MQHCKEAEPNDTPATINIYVSAASLWVVEFLVTMQESVTASLGRLKTGEHHPLDAGVEEFHRVLAEVATIR